MAYNKTPKKKAPIKKKRKATKATKAKNQRKY